LPNLLDTSLNKVENYDTHLADYVRNNWYPWRKPITKCISKSSDELH